MTVHCKTAAWIIKFKHCRLLYKNTGQVIINNIKGIWKMNYFQTDLILANYQFYQDFREDFLVNFERNFLVAKIYSGKVAFSWKKRMIPFNEVADHFILWWTVHLLKHLLTLTLLFWKIHLSESLLTRNCRKEQILNERLFRAHSHGWDSSQIALYLNCQHRRMGEDILGWQS